MDLTTERTLEALEGIAAELERLRVLKEYELGVRVVEDPDPRVQKLDRAADDE
jgi:hypothetical protein